MSRTRERSSLLTFRLLTPLCETDCFYISKFKNLKFIQLTSAGLDRVPAEYIKSKNISLFNARGVYSVPMAEFAVLGTLLIYKKIFFFRENQKYHVWQINRELFELCG